MSQELVSLIRLIKEGRQDDDIFGANISQTIKDAAIQMKDIIEGRSWRWGSSDGHFFSVNELKVWEFHKVFAVLGQETIKAAFKAEKDGSASAKQLEIVRDVVAGGRKGGTTVKAAFEAVENSSASAEQHETVMGIMVGIMNGCATRAKIAEAVRGGTANDAQKKSHEAHQRKNTKLAEQKRERTGMFLADAGDSLPVTCRSVDCSRRGAKRFVRRRLPMNMVPANMQNELRPIVHKAMDTGVETWYNGVASASAAPIGMSICSIKKQCRKGPAGGAPNSKNKNNHYRYDVPDRPDAVWVLGRCNCNDKGKPCVFPDVPTDKSDRWIHYNCITIGTFDHRVASIKKEVKAVLQRQKKRSGAFDDIKKWIEKKNPGTKCTKNDAFLRVLETMVDDGDLIKEGNAYSIA
mmetsp:Transcript_20409/g.44606  ORF Transcript_20409/g.44606 Transcript_20409/m.44606 type:complete len:407 (+) Transcript_20409:272-1492(+)